MPKVNTDPNSINELLERSIDKIYPSKEDLKKILQSGKRLRIYNGADATGSQLHLGHSTNYILLEKFRRLGHEVIILFGDFTAMIGDPTDKKASRTSLTKKEVDINLKTWKSQISKIVNFKDKNNPPKIVKNSKWLSKLSPIKLITLMSNFTVQQMLERDMFQKRIADHKPIFNHEFLYPLLQGYDSVALDVDVEIGGTDQTFNMLVGRTLQQKINNKEKFVVTTTLLENPKTGKKLMSKSEGGYIGLNDSPLEMFGKTMALPDETIISVFTDCTYVPQNEINDMKIKLETNKINPKDLKIQLGYELVKIYHNEKKALEAKENFIKTFQKKEVPDDILEIKVSKGEELSEVLLKNNFVKSKSDFKRLIDEGAITRLEKNENINDYHFKLTESETLKIGKKRFIRIVFNNFHH